MNTLVKKLVAALEVENENVSFASEDNNYYYFSIEDEFFTGMARVDKDASDNEYYVEFKENGTNTYNGNGILEVA